ncbi:hypothetical protein RRF57_000103 [Xylaria bambusicola]|uniref:Uncharacterized protein n=1 Tax=Xylaria bambusicola TaxID=326684 RepID=A0AAN7UBK9_9PEZI
MLGSKPDPTTQRFVFVSRGDTSYLSSLQSALSTVQLPHVQNEMISTNVNQIVHQLPSQKQTGGQPIKLKPIRRERPPQYEKNAYPERFYTKLRKRGFDHDESRAMAMEMEDKRFEMFETPAVGDAYMINYEEFKAVFKHYDDQAKELERQEMKAEEARSRDKRPRGSSSKLERREQDAEFRLQEERRAREISIANVYVENAWQHSMEKNKLNIVKGQHELLPLLDKTQEDASKKSQERIFGEHLNNVKPLEAGAAYSKVEKAANSIVQNSNNYVHKGRTLWRLAPEHEMPGLPASLKVSNTGSVLKAEQEAVMAHTRQKQILEVQRDIDSLWQHAQDKHIELPEWYMPTQHGMVNIREVTNPKKIKDMIDKPPEQAEHERLKLESELHAIEAKRAALTAEIEKAEPTRDQMGELGRANIADRHCDHEYAESLKKRSKSVQRGKEFIAATKSSGNRALNKSALGAH